jgi:hypothetical protein
MALGPRVLAAADAITRALGGARSS